VNTPSMQQNQVLLVAANKHQMNVVLA
jgi:hypothetical protein